MQPVNLIYGTCLLHVPEVVHTNDNVKIVQSIEIHHNGDFPNVLIIDFKLILNFPLSNGHPINLSFMAKKSRENLTFYLIYSKQHFASFILVNRTRFEI